MYVKIEIRFTKLILLTITQWNQRLHHSNFDSIKI